jgi:hypothetical protein
MIDYAALGQRLADSLADTPVAAGELAEAWLQMWTDGKHVVFNANIAPMRQAKNAAVLLLIEQMEKYFVTLQEANSSFAARVAGLDLLVEVGMDSGHMSLYIARKLPGGEVEWFSDLG